MLLFVCVGLDAQHENEHCVHEKVCENIMNEGM